MLRAKKRTPIPYPSNVLTFGLTIKSIKEFGGASNNDANDDAGDYVSANDDVSNDVGDFVSVSMM
jgi:hypothetical protein